MLISQEQLWESLDRIIFPLTPRQLTCRDVGYALPEALNQAAVVMVRDDRYGEEYYKNPMVRFKDEDNVIDALRELRDNGFLNFIEAVDDTSSFKCS